MNTHDRAGLIGGSREHPIEFDATKERGDSGGLFVAVSQGRVVVFGGGHFQVLFEVGDFSAQFCREFEFLLDIGAFTERGLSFALFVPEAWSEGFVGQFGE